MLINFSNHPSEYWPERQLKETLESFGEVIDIQFPEVNPQGDEKYIKNLSEEYSEKCVKIISDSKDSTNAVHIMGEFNFCFAVISILIRKGIKCIASTSERIAIEDLLGEKMSKFSFVKFREYKL